MTLAGVLLDEVALMPKSFVEQALARCSVAGSKFWFNCNPEGPEHWFKKEWVDKEAEHNALHLHFTMEDNPSLSPEIKTRYESMYSGVFYQRYILGEWRVAEGLVYTMFNKDFHAVSNIPRPYEKYYISCDYGTLNPTSAGLWGLADGKWYRVREYYYDARKAGRSLTDEEHEVIRRHGRFRVEKASNSVIDGIRDVATHLQMGDLFICEGCKDCIREFGLYRWDEKAAGDKPIKADDHAMDDLRYFVHTVFAPPRFSFE